MFKLQTMVRSRSLQNRSRRNRRQSKSRRQNRRMRGGADADIKKRFDVGEYLKELHSCVAKPSRNNEQRKKDLEEAVTTFTTKFEDLNIEEHSDEELREKVALKTKEAFASIINQESCKEDDIQDYEMPCPWKYKEHCLETNSEGKSICEEKGLMSLERRTRVPYTSLCASRGKHGRALPRDDVREIIKIMYPSRFKKMYLSVRPR